MFKKIVLVISLIFVFGCNNNVYNEKEIKLEEKKEIIGNKEVKNTNKEIKNTNLELEKCSDGCKEGYMCYSSKYQGMGPNGLVIGEEQGDLMCHKVCKNNEDCLGGECRSVKIIGGDVVANINFCFNK